jgi:hypothetical protein
VKNKENRMEKENVTETREKERNQYAGAFSGRERRDPSEASAWSHGPWSISQRTWEGSASQTFVSPA